MGDLQVRKATSEDIATIIALLIEDELGASRQEQSPKAMIKYHQAFQLIDCDPNQYLMVVENNDMVIATCHLTIMPSLTYSGATRMQIEAVRVSAKFRGQKIGQYMIDQAISYAREKGASIIQLTTNKKRNQAKNFYEKIGFVASHEGMKLMIDPKTNS